MELARIDFSQIGEESLKKISLAKRWLKKRFPEEAAIVEEKLKHFLSMSPDNSDGYQDTLIIHSSRNFFGEYAITAEYANDVRTEKLAARLVKAAYLVVYRGQGLPSEMSDRLAEEKKGKIANRPARPRLNAVFSLNGT
jgi:hypothetical protein